jgi:outer membrane protein assembly factor BamE (lipoprotein component of BamABCDE complex)
MNKLLTTLALALALTACASMKYGSAASPEKVKQYVADSTSSERIANCMLQRRICKGMTYRQVELTIGYPSGFASTHNLEIYRYNRASAMYVGQVAFENGRVVSRTRYY